MDNPVMNPVAIAACVLPPQSRPRGLRSARCCAAILILLVFTSADASAASWKLRSQADQAYQRQDYKTAFQKYSKLTKENGGNSYAECQLGIMYERGEGVQKDVAQAITWYRLAGAEGNVTAEINLALIFDFGKGVAVDHAEAAKWYRYAAEHGNVLAEHNLGWDYEHGEGIEQDYLQAARWYGLAADQEYTKAQTALGRLYWSGKGLPQDYVQAASWFLIAKEGTGEDAQSALESFQAIQQRMRADQVEEARRIAIAYVEKVQARKLEEQRRAEEERAAQVAAFEEADSESQGPSYLDMVNQGLQNTIARQRAAIGMAQARQREMEVARQAQIDQRNQAAAEQERQRQTALAMARQQEAAALAAVVAQQSSPQPAVIQSRSEANKYPMVFHDECIAVKTRSDGFVEFTNTCSQLMVIKEYIQRPDGRWEAGEDCRSTGQYVLDFPNGTNGSSVRYIAHAQAVKSCSDMFLLKWPPDPK